MTNTATDRTSWYRDNGYLVPRPGRTSLAYPDTARPGDIYRDGNSPSNPYRVRRREILAVEAAGTYVWLTLAGTKRRVRIHAGDKIVIERRS